MKTTCALAVGLGMVAAANAAVIIDATNITYSGSFAEAPLVLGPATTITDGSGLSEALTVANIGTVTHAGFGDGTNSWVTSDPGGVNSDFFASNGGQTVSFDIIFDQTYTVDSISTWGYGWNADQGNTAATYSIDYGVGDFAGGNEVAAFGLTTFGQSSTLALSGFTADRVRITVTDNFFGQSVGGDRVGLAEVAFVGDVAAVPEPSSAALLGLGGLALILRRRK